MKRKLKKSKSKKMIIKKCGLDLEEIETKLRFAKKNGMKYKRFLLNRAWELSNEEILELNKKIEKYMEKKDDELHLLKLQTGVLKETIVARKFLVSRYGISEKTYLARKIYLLNEKDFENYLNALKQIKQNKKKERDFYINIVKERTGWTLEKTIKEIECADKMGVDYKYYVRKGAYTMNIKEIEELAKFVKIDKERVKKNANEYYDKIKKITKWNETETELKTRISKSLTDCSYEDYYAFGFYKLSANQQKKYITLGNFNKMRAKYNEHHKAREIFDDKAKFNETFKDYINRIWFVNTEISFEEFEKKVSKLDKIFVKPIAAQMGIGIKKFEIPKGHNKNKLKELYDELVKLPKSIVEEYIVQHQLAMEICDKSVNTVRITTLNNNGKCEYLYAVFRMGIGNIVDNFHAGGIAATIDIKTGKVITNACDLDRKIYKTNPYSNKKIKNIQIPHWSTIKETCEKIFDLVEDVKLVGWDFAITETGVELIEGNPGVSYVLAQIPNVESKKGINYNMAEKFLREDTINDISKKNKNNPQTY